jgi:hypothetical protein
VDANSGPQTEVNPYVFSCAGDNVCYMNVFDGGFSQYGCGTASDMAATVLNSASGVTAILTRPTVSVSYTQSISTLSEPTTLGTITSSSTRTLTSSASSSSSSESTTVLDPAATTDATAAAPPAPTDTGYRTGAIVGGTIGGLAVLIALVALAFFFLRRRNANVRQGPGPGGVRGKVISPPQPGTGTGFAALAHDDSDAFETGPVSSVFNQPPQHQQQHPQMTTIGAATTAPTNRAMLPPLATGPPMPFQSEVSPVDHHDLDTAFAYPNAAAIIGGSAGAGALSAGAASVSSYPPTSSGGLSGGAVSNITPDTAAAMQQYPGPHPASYAGGSGLLMGMSPLLLNRGAERQLESDQIPLTSSSREIDDFSQGFHAALGRIGEEDEEEDGEDLGGYQYHQGQGKGQQQEQQQAGYRDDVGGGAYGEGTMDSTGSGSGRPLWQQNRRQSRNLMWM